MKYLCDKQRHLICVPFSIDGLHAMAENLGIAKCWFHHSKYPHYDIPLRRVEEIKAKCEVVRPRELFEVIKQFVDGAK